MMLETLTRQTTGEREKLQKQDGVIYWKDFWIEELQEGKVLNLLLLDIRFLEGENTKWTEIKKKWGPGQGKKHQEETG